MPTRHQGVPPPRRALVPRGAPGPLLAPIFWYISAFDLKNYREDFRDEAPPSRGRTWAGPILLSGGAILPGILPSGRGKSKPSTSPTISHRGRTNLHQHLHQHHLISNPSSSLVFNLCLKTSDWYLWVASSVDYSL